MSKQLQLEHAELKSQLIVGDPTYPNWMFQNGIYLLCINEDIEKCIIYLKDVLLNKIINHALLTRDKAMYVNELKKYYENYSVCTDQYFEQLCDKYDNITCPKLKRRAKTFPETPMPILFDEMQKPASDLISDEYIIKLEDKIKILENTNDLLKDENKNLRKYNEKFLDFNNVYHNENMSLNKKLEIERKLRNFIIAKLNDFEDKKKYKGIEIKNALFIEFGKYINSSSEE